MATDTEHRDDEIAPAPGRLIRLHQGRAILAELPLGTSDDVNALRLAMLNAMAEGKRITKITVVDSDIRHIDNVAH